MCYEYRHEAQCADEHVAAIKESRYYCKAYRGSADCRSLSKGGDIIHIVPNEKCDHCHENLPAEEALKWLEEEIRDWVSDNLYLGIFKQTKQRSPTEESEAISPEAVNGEVIKGGVVNSDDGSMKSVFLPRPVQRAPAESD
jgi:hypothetical protein